MKIKTKGKQMKQIKKILLASVFALILLLTLSQPVYARMGSTGGGSSSGGLSGGSTDSGVSMSSNSPNSGNSSHNNNYDSNSDIVMAIIFLLLLGRSIIAMLREDSSNKRALLTQNMTMHDFENFLLRNNIELNFRFDHSPLIDQCLNMYDSAQAIYDQAIIDAINGNKHTIKALKQYLGRPFLTTMKKEIRLKANNKEMDDVIVTKSEATGIAKIKQKGHKYLIMMIHCQGLDNEANTKDFDIDHSQVAWTDGVVFDITNLPRIRIVNIIYGDTFHLGKKEFDRSEEN